MQIALMSGMPNLMSQLWEYFSTSVAATVRQLQAPSYQPPQGCTPVHTSSHLAKYISEVVEFSRPVGREEVRPYCTFDSP